MRSSEGSDSPRVVLVVDDDVQIRRAVRRALERVFSVVEAATHQQAMSLLAGRAFHGVVTDLDLGEGPSGATLLSEARASSPQSRRILMTGNASALRHVADPAWEALLLKPFSMAELIELLRS